VAEGCHDALPKKDDYGKRFKAPRLVFLQAPKPIDPKQQNFWSREFPKAKN
jgi:hypothetical protein